MQYARKNICLAMGQRVLGPSVRCNDSEKYGTNGNNVFWCEKSRANGYDVFWAFMDLKNAYGFEKRRSARRVADAKIE